MAKSVSYNKREIEKKKQEKRLDKLKRKEERKANASTGSLDDMIAYVDENGVITNTPPDPVKKRKINIDHIEVSTPRKEEVEAAELKGRVDFFNPDKGFGFIKSTNGMDKYFFHITSAPASIDEGDRVTFELERGKKGMNAVNIVIAE